MTLTIEDYFKKYAQCDAPFMHKQFSAWKKQKPLNGLKIIHHVPVFENTLLKIACLIIAGAEVTVTHPYSFCQPSDKAIQVLQNERIRFVPDFQDLKGEIFDIYFDCGAELYQVLGDPKIGAIELTGSGDTFYRQQILNTPVLSIDRSLTKQLETVFGCAQSSYTALSLLTNSNPATKSWLIFGFGKIGRGLVYCCKHHKAPVTIVDPSPKQRQIAERLGIKAINPHNLEMLRKAIESADIIMTATGKKEIMKEYPSEWFSNKILANLGVYDEFGPNFSSKHVLNDKKALNFVLEDPTPIRYIDPEFYIHNHAALLLLDKDWSSSVHNIPQTIDKEIISQWCSYHNFSLNTIKRWFITHERQDSV